MEYTFQTFHTQAKEGICLVLKRMLKEDNFFPVTVCIGSDLAIYDTLGPLCGTMLREKGIPSFLYGTLRNPVTAKEVKNLTTFLKQINPRGKRLVIDAAVGSQNEIGQIKIAEGGIVPGKGVGKSNPPFGDISILGIVAERSIFSQSLTDYTRLKLVYSMAQTISDGLCLFLNSRILEKIG